MKLETPITQFAEFKVYVGEGRNFRTVGTFTCDGPELDRAVETYLPNSPEHLRIIATDRMDGAVDLSAVKEVSSLLVILADLDRELTLGEAHS